MASRPQASARPQQPRAAIVEAGKKFLRLVNGVDPDDERKKIDLTMERDYMCGDCGVRPSLIPDTCSGCGGYAQPALNKLLVDAKFKSLLDKAAGES